MNRGFLRTLTVLAATLVAALPAATLAEGQPRALGQMISYHYNEDWSAENGWNASHGNGTATVVDGVYRVVRTEANTGTFYAHDRASMYPATADWRASVDVRLVASTPGDGVARAGLSLRGPLGDRLDVAIDPDGDVLVTRVDREGNAEPSPVHFRHANAFRGGAGAMNTLALERRDGYYIVSVNDDYVARTRVIDFALRKIGVLVTSKKAFTVDFDNLRLAATGHQDSRLLRLLGKIDVPGARNLLGDSFDRDKKVKPEDEAWKLTRTATMRSEIKDGRLLVDIAAGADDQYLSSVGPSVEARGRFGSSRAPFVARATVEKVAGDGGYVRGILMTGMAPDDAPLRPRFQVLVTDTQLSVNLFNAKGEQTTFVDFVETPSLDGKRAELAMVVMPDNQVMVFVNDEYQTTVQVPADFQWDTFGLRSAGSPTTIAFDDVNVQEL